ncbi:MAG: hypothetical protein SPI25_00475 [Dialister sp.]|nr:hypothetical protein [Dialister sp.]
MEKILFSVIAMLLVPWSVFAISLAKLERDPSGYMVVNQTENTRTHVDAASVEALRHALPFYTLQGQG